MEEVSVIGLDLAKNFIQLCAMTRHGEIVDERRVRRDKLLSRLSRYPSCCVAMEACGGAHYWGREITALGHRVRLLHTAHVRPYVGVQKNDRADARAICEAAGRARLRSVPIKSRAQQDLRVLLRLREGVVAERTRLINRARGLLGEYGLVLPKGARAFRRGLREKLATPEWRAALSQPIHAEFTELSARVDELFAKAIALRHQLRDAVARDETARRLCAVPGIGPITAAALIAAIEDAWVFAGARHLSAWLGLVPRQRSTGGRARLGGITKHGQGALRRLLVQGARSLITAAKRHETPRHSIEAWIHTHRDRLHANVLAVAVANKLARVAWAVMASGEAFKANPRAAA